jgi:hypothetical protein
MLFNSCSLQVRYKKIISCSSVIKKKRRTTLIVASLEGNSSSDICAGKSYMDLYLNLWILLLTYLFTYLLTYLLSIEQSPWEANRFSLVKKFPAFYGSRRFITSFTGARHLSLSRAGSIQSIPPNPTSWRSILILSSHLRSGLQSGLFPSGFHTKTLFAPLLSPHTCYMPCPSHSSRFNQPNNIGWGA